MKGGRVALRIWAIRPLFDGLDNRKTVLDLFRRLGAGLPDRLADELRAGFLRGLLNASTTGFAHRPTWVDPCSAVQAYKLFVAITGAFGVPVETGAKILEEAVRHRDEWLEGVLCGEAEVRALR